MIRHTRAPVRHTRAPSVIPAPPSVIPAPPSVIPAPPPSFLRRQEPPANTHRSPNSSLPPSKGEVRWGVGVPSRPHRSCAPRSPTPRPLRHSCTPSVIPAPPSVIPAPSPSYPRPHPSFLRRQEPPANIHRSPNSSLPPGRGEVRWGVGVPSRPHWSCAPRSPTPRPVRHTRAPSVIPAPPSVIPAPPSVIPAQAGTPRQQPPLPQFIPPPFQGGG